jgi:hypothetical protein
MTLQITDPSSRQRGRPTWTGQELSEQEKISGHKPQTGLYDAKTDTLTDRQ